eukprot:1196373-Prorocentrum_minimum.AAC.3
MGAGCADEGEKSGGRAGHGPFDSARSWGVPGGPDITYSPSGCQMLMSWPVDIHLVARAGDTQEGPRVGGAQSNPNRAEGSSEGPSGSGGEPPRGAGGKGANVNMAEAEGAWTKVELVVEDGGSGAPLVTLNVQQSGLFVQPRAAKAYSPLLVHRRLYRSHSRVLRLFFRLPPGCELEMCAAYFDSEWVDPQSRLEAAVVRLAYAALEEAGPSGLRPQVLAARLQV